MIKAVIFDLDGTLLDTLEDIADTVNTALAVLGYPEHPTRTYRDFIGHGYRHHRTGSNEPRKAEA